MLRRGINVPSARAANCAAAKINIVGDGNRCNMTVIIEIDQESCIQCGRCYNDECPEVFREGDDGTAEIAEEYRDGSSAKGKAPDDMLGCVNKAADACPETVITIGQ